MPRKTKQTTCDPKQSVIKIFTTFTEPNFSQPWSMSQQQKCTGTGFAIDGRRIITNAHVVAYHTAIQVRKHNDSTKYTATVVGISHDSDIAILEVADDLFWESVIPFALGTMPLLQQPVVVLGYPVGGETLCVTQGVVSRIDYHQYAHSNKENLIVQVDAAINPGNSGGPAIDEDGAVIGVAFQGMDEGDNIGYIIPVPVLEHVLADFEKHGKVTGTGRLSFRWQSMENDALRESYGLPVS